LKFVAFVLFSKLRLDKSCAEVNGHTERYESGHDDGSMTQSALAGWDQSEINISDRGLGKSIARPPGRRTLISTAHGFSPSERSTLPRSPFGFRPSALQTGRARPLSAPGEAD